MQTAQKRDACRKEKFWFRKITQSTSECCPAKLKCNGTNGTNGTNCTYYTNGTNDTNGTIDTNGINGTNDTNDISNGIIDANDTNGTNGIIESNGINGRVNGCSSASKDEICADKFELMTLADIFNGKVFIPLH